MNNATFFECGKNLTLAYNKYYDAYKGARFDLASFACNKACTAFYYDIGQIVQWTDGKFGIVDKYDSEVDDRHCFVKIHVTGDANGWWRVDENHPDRYNARIPKGLLDLAKAQLLAHCPLKEAKCQS